MKEYKNSFYKNLPHFYFLFTVLGMLMLPAVPQIAMLFLSVGASSAYYSFGVFAAATVSRLWGIGAFVWTVIFPFALIITYILRVKNINYPLFVFSLLDTVFVSFFALHSLHLGNMYGFYLAFFDFILSVCVTLILWKGNQQYLQKAVDEKDG